MCIAVFVIKSVIILLCFLQEHFQVCPKFPQACEKCGQENIPRDMVNHFSVATHVLLSQEISK